MDSGITCIRVGKRLPGVPNQSKGAEVGPAEDSPAGNA